MSLTALNRYLKPFQPFFEMPHVSEICINQPLGLWVEQAGQFTYYDVPELSMDFLLQFAGLVGEFNQREISPEYPTLSSVLPDGSRVQFVMEPACEKGSFICAIRRQSIVQTCLENYFKGSPSRQPLSANEALLHLYQSGSYLDFLKQAVLCKKNIIISGGTSTGKTTFLNALLEHVPLSERLITIETDREVKT